MEAIATVCFSLHACMQGDLVTEETNDLFLLFTQDIDLDIKSPADIAHGARGLHGTAADMAETPTASHAADLMLCSEYLLRHTHTQHTMSWRTLPHPL